ncbi:MAG TPA: hypothetical protein VF395_14420 [Polyangiaceae bacterium]
MRTSSRSRTGRSLRGAVAGAALILSPPALAQEASGASGAAADPESAPKGPKLVVILDIASNATDNSELRAALYDVAREQGYEPAGKLDVEGVASRASLMQAGGITAEPSELAELRRALDVAALVRVSKDPSGSVHVTLVLKRGVESRLIAAGSASGPEPLRAALTALLPPIYKAAEKKPPGDSPAPGALERQNGASAGSLLLDPHTEKPALRPREAWERRGGLRPTYGALLLASGTQIRHVGFTTTDTAGRAISGSGSATGVGGGIGVRVGISYLPIPDPNLSTGSFVVFRFGAGLDTNVLYTRTPHGYDTAKNVTYGNQALWVSSLPFNLGFAIASGKFSGDASWRGVLIGFAYAPAAQFSMDLKYTSGDFRFNPAGAEATVDITRMDTSEDDAAEPHIRLALSGLVPLDDARPGFLSLGIGVIYY